MVVIIYSLCPIRSTYCNHRSMVQILDAKVRRVLSSSAGRRSCTRCVGNGRPKEVGINGSALFGRHMAKQFLVTKA